MKSAFDGYGICDAHLRRAEFVVIDRHGSYPISAHLRDRETARAFATSDDPLMHHLLGED